MDVTTEQATHWSNVQAYSLAVVCLLLGVITGYLLHPPKPAATKLQQGYPQAVDTMNAAPPTPDQLKHMAEKMAEPALAELQKDPNNADLLAKVAGTYFRAHQFPLAVDYYERAIKIKPTAEGFVSLSNSYHYTGSDDRAFDALNRALQIDPRSGNALYNLGLLNWQVKNDPKAAIEAWERFLKTNPNHPGRAHVESMIAKAKQHLKIPVGAAEKPAS
jgi:cytochrome c-type biogenesis protein CcmH/NrfG